MKRIFAAVACAAALVIAGSTQAQIRPLPVQGILIGLRPASQATVEQRARVQALQAQPGAGELNIARLQTDNLRNAAAGQTVQFQVTPQRSIAARALSVQTSGGITTWRGEVPGQGNRPPGTATIVMNSTGVMGTIHGADGRTYRLRPLPGGETAIVELNYATMPPDHDDAGGGSGGLAQLRNPVIRAQINPGVVTPNTTGILSPTDNRARVATTPNTTGIVTPTEDLSDTGVSRRLAGNANLLQLATRPSNVSLIERYRINPEIWRLLRPPTIDVLVAFTPGAQSFTGDMNLFATQAIEETNGSFINSNVWARVRLVGTMSVSYSESGRDYPTMVDHLTVNGDGQIDTVHAQRDALRADVVVLVVHQPAKCGRAREINATAAQAFVVVQWDCATGYYSFGHEIAHLAGARHDEPSDTTDTPYAWGHGFRHLAAAPNGWRTIMGYRCESNLCEPRLQYWSSPLTMWNGLPMGTAADADNRRVWNDRAATVAGFR